MKNIYFAFILFFLSINCFSQDNESTNSLFELQKKKVKIDISKKIFTTVYQNMYVSQNPDALILALFIPISYAEQKNRIKNGSVFKEIAFKGEKKLQNENVLWFEGIIIKNEIEYTKQIYYIKQDTNTCIELTTMLPVDAKKSDIQLIIKIIGSVIKNN